MAFGRVQIELHSLFFLCRYALGANPVAKFIHFRPIQKLFDTFSQIRQILGHSSCHHQHAHKDHCFIDSFRYLNRAKFILSSGMKAPKGTNAIFLRILALAASVLFLIGCSPKSPFAQSNLVAWCIVPFDAKERSPEERAQMLNDLGILRVLERTP